MCPSIPQRDLQVVGSNKLSANPGLLNARSAGSTRPSQIQAHMNVQPVRETAVVKRDLVGPAVERAGNAIGGMMMVVAEKDAQRAAADAAMAFETAAHNLWLGSGDPTSADYKPGYASLNSRDAVNAHDTYQGALTEARAAASSALNEAARSKFLDRSHGTFVGYRNQGASHATAARTQWDKQIAQREQQAHFQRVNEALTVQDPQTALAETAQYAAHAYSGLPKSARPAAVQGYHQGMISFLASTDGAPEKIMMYQELHQNSMDMATTTQANNALTAVIKKANQELRQAEIDGDARATKQKQENDLLWFSESFKPSAALDMERGMQMVLSGILSPSVYSAVRDRRETRNYLPAISAADEIAIKNDLVNEDTTLDETMAEAMQYDDATVRRLGNFAVNTQGYARRNDLRYGYERIEKMVKETSRGPGTQRKILMLQRDYEKRLGKESAESALNSVLNMVEPSRNYVPQIITLGDKIIDFTLVTPQEIKAQIEAAKSDASVTPEAVETAYGEFDRYLSSRSTPAKTENSRNR